MAPHTKVAYRTLVGLILMALVLTLSAAGQAADGFYPLMDAVIARMQRTAASRT